MLFKVIQSWSHAINSDAEQHFAYHNPNDDQRLVYIYIQAYLGIHRIGPILCIKVTVRPVPLLLFPRSGTHDIASAIATADPPPWPCRCFSCTLRQPLYVYRWAD